MSQLWMSQTTVTMLALRKLGNKAEDEGRIWSAADENEYNIVLRDSLDQERPPVPYHQWHEHP